MAKSCTTANVDAARKQTERMLADAKRKIGAGPICQVPLLAAQAAFSTADQFEGLERRNEYVRASFQAGQALACASIAGIKEGKRQKLREPGTKKPKAPRKARTKRVPRG